MITRSVLASMTCAVIACGSAADDGFWSLPEPLRAEESRATDLYEEVAFIPVEPKPITTVCSDCRLTRAILTSYPPNSPEHHLLSFIGKHEAPKGYDQVWSKIRHAHLPEQLTGRPLSALTIAEVLAWQDSIDTLYMSEAAGRFQVMEDTLRKLVNKGRIDPSLVFDKRAQDAVAMLLLEDAGWPAFKRKELSLPQFGTNVARIWAGLPALSGPKAGRSVYHGFNGNRATVSAGPFRAMLLDVRARLDADPVVLASTSAKNAPADGIETVTQQDVATTIIARPR